MYWITGVLGLALIIAPFVMNYSNNPAALWTSIILGAIVLLVSAYKAWAKDEARWEYMVAGIAGLLAVFAPFILGFSALTTAMWTSIILGGLLAFLAGYEGFFAKPRTQ